MRKPSFLLHSFQTKVTLAFIFVLLFIVAAGNLFFYEYNLDLHFKEFKDNLLVITVSILLSGIFISLFIGFLVARRVTGSIEKLIEGTRKIALGDLNARVEVSGRDEIAELVNSFNDMAAKLVDYRNKLQDYFYRAVQSMVRSLEAKDSYTKGHSDRVSEYARKITLEMGFSNEKAELLKRVSELHDIGKLGIDESILNKPASLSEEEWQAIRKHPVIGEEILKPIFLDDEMLMVVRSHHEHYDGTGYPDGLKGEKINIFAQIVCVADAYDAMTSSRAYRPALTKEEALERLKKGSGTQFNPEIVDAFIRVLGYNI